MKTRTITAVIMGLIFIPLIMIPQLIIPFQILMTIGVVIATLEMINMFDKEKTMSKKLKGITIGLTLAVYFSIAWYTSKTNHQFIYEYVGKKIVPINLGVIFISLGLLVWEKDFTGVNIGQLLTTVFYVGFGAGSIVLLRVMGLNYISFLFLTTVLTDIFAYLIGVKFGKTKMAPLISPKKSWEGAIFGTLIASVVAGSFALFYGKIFQGGIFNPNGYETLLDGIKAFGQVNRIGKALMIYPLAILLSVVGQTGDLVASKFKRTYEIKDFGTVFPGHGGVMDRFDSSLFASMFLVIFLLAFAI